MTREELRALRLRLIGDMSALGKASARTEPAFQDVAQRRWRPADERLELRGGHSEAAAELLAAERKAAMVLGRSLEVVEQAIREGAR